MEGRTDEILRFPRGGGGEAVLLPMAVATVVEETRGVRRYQVLQTAADVLTIRLDHDPGADRAEVWQRVRARLADLLRAHGAVDVRLRLAAEPRTRTRAAESSGTCCRLCRRLLLGSMIREMACRSARSCRATPEQGSPSARPAA